MGVRERLEQRRQLLAERERERPGTASRDAGQAGPRRGGSAGYDLSGLEGLAYVFPPLAIVFILALPILGVASLLRRNR